MRIRLVLATENHIPLQGRPIDIPMTIFDVDSLITIVSAIFFLPVYQTKIMRLVGLAFFTVATLAATGASTTSVEEGESRKVAMPSSKATI